MSNIIISSSIIEPAIRQARRLSEVTEEESPNAPSLSHASLRSPVPSQTAAGNNSPTSPTVYTEPRQNIIDAITRSPSHPNRHHPQPLQRATSDPIVFRSVSPHDEPSHADPEELASSSPSLTRLSARHADRSYNPSYGIIQNLGSTRASRATSSPTRVSGRTATNLGMDGESRPREAEIDATRIESDGVIMSTSLPEDDGMRLLRRRIHEIRNMNVSNEEKAIRMHSIMIEKYSEAQTSTLRPNSPVSHAQNRPVTPISMHSLSEAETRAASPATPTSPLSVKVSNTFNVTPVDLIPSYRPVVPDESSDESSPVEDVVSEDDGPSFGCAHYKRNVKVQCFDCRRWYPCRHCHDQAETHALDRRKTENMLCMLCRTPQAAGDHCKKCGSSAAWYYCDICKLWDDDSSKKIYHCLDCGICRKGEGLGKDYVHCKKCNVCISIGFFESHRCVERATDCDCPICGEYLFNSQTPVVSLSCGHYMHKQCYHEYMKVAYKCPFCKKSAVNMELQWRKLTHSIESQPMPSKFANTRVTIQCNDCSAKSSVRYHWLGNKCQTCDSYNTNEIQLLTEGEDGKTIEVDSVTSAGLEELRDQELIRPSTASNSSPPRRPALRGTGSYFHSEQQIPTSRPSTAATALEQLRLTPYEMLQRVSRSLSPIRHYLNTPLETSLRNISSGIYDASAGSNDDGVGFWGSDGRFLSGDEEEDDDEDNESGDEDSSDDELSRGNDLGESDDESGSNGRTLDELDSIPWHA